MRSLYQTAMLGLCLVLYGTALYALPLDRPNQKRELYAHSWGQEVTDLAKSCESLNGAECAMLGRLITMPHAYWIGAGVTVSKDIHEDLHNLIRDAQREGRVPTIVLHALPNQGCEGDIRHGKRFVAENYLKWVDQVSNAIRYYQSMPINIIIEPGGLAEVVTDREQVCGKRTKTEVLEERIGLIHYVSWCFALLDKDKHRINPHLRLFVDIGHPSHISGPREKMAIADALENIIKGAVIDGVSVNVGGHDSFDESVTWAKEVIGLVRSSANTKLTIAVDIGRSGARVEGQCNVRGAALDVQPPTLAHADPRVELAMIIKHPGERDGDGPSCNGAASVGNFDREMFMEYLRNSTLRHTFIGH